MLAAVHCVFRHHGGCMRFELVIVEGHLTLQTDHEDVPHSLNPPFAGRRPPQDRAKGTRS